MMARIGFVVLFCLMALTISIGVIPGIQERSRNETRDNLAEQQRIQSAKAGQQLLHHFDCTYGVAIQATLAEAERSYKVQAHNALINRHAQLASGNRKAANLAARSRANSLRTAAKYEQLRQSLRPLAGSPGHRIPCQPKKGGNQ